MAEALEFRFGELEAILADLNEIPSAQRTAFQARLKNFHRLGFPEGMGQGRRGKAVIYGARELMLMAVAVELTQLGLTPERTIEVIRADEYPVWMAVRMAADALMHRREVFNPGPGDTGNPPDQKVWGFSWRWADSESTDPLSMFLYFDPSVLSPWTDEGDDIASATFFYGGVGVVRENITRWTTGPTRRISLINVTALLFNIAAYLAGPDGLSVVGQIRAAADEWLTRGDFDLDGWLVATAKPALMEAAANPVPFRRDGQQTIARLEDVVDLELPFVFIPLEHSRDKPDMIFRLPGQRELLVDAKMPLLGDIPQDGFYDRVNDLVEQPYRTAFSDRTHYQVLFVPYDEFLSKAVAQDKGLFDWAFEQGMILVTPSTMHVILEAIGTAWAERRKTPEGQEEWDALLTDQTPMVKYGVDQEA